MCPPAKPSFSSMLSFWLWLAGVFAFVLTNYIPCVPECRGDDCYNNCRYGIENVCGKSMCARGPGERCGGYSDQLGKCGSGMHCDSCGFCRGCSIKALLSGVDPKEHCYNSTHHCVSRQFY